MHNVLNDGAYICVLSAVTI